MKNVLIKIFYIEPSEFGKKITGENIEKKVKDLFEKYLISESRKEFFAFKITSRFESEKLYYGGRVREFFGGFQLSFYSPSTPMPKIAQYTKNNNNSEILTMS